MHVVDQYSIGLHPPTTKINARPLWLIDVVAPAKSGFDPGLYLLAIDADIYHLQ